MPPLQDGGNSSTEGHHRTERLNDKARPPGCLRRRSSPRRLKKVHVFRTQRDRLPIPKPTLWSQRCSENIYKTYARRTRATTKRRYTPRLLPRRHLCFRTYPRPDDQSYSTPDFSPNEIRVLDQLQEEQTGTSFQSGVSGLRVQHETNDNHDTCDQIPKDPMPDQSGGEADIFLQVDCESPREDHLNPSGSEECPTAHSVSPTGLGPPSAKRVTTVVEPLPTLRPSQTGGGMVEEGSSPVERPTYTNTGPREDETGLDHFHGRIEHRMGSEVENSSDLRLLDDGGEIRVHKRPRTESDPIRDPAPCSKRQRQDDPLIHGQHYGFEICQETGQHVIDPTPETRTRDS